MPSFRSHRSRRPAPSIVRLLALSFISISIFVLSTVPVSATPTPPPSRSQPPSIRPRQDPANPIGGDAKRFKEAIAKAPQTSSMPEPTSTGTPRPFDSSIGNNFSNAACKDFLRRFSMDSAVIDCMPVSLLLQTSLGFFETSKYRNRLTSLLDSSCKVDVDKCGRLMDSYAIELVKNDVCGPDLRAENPLVMQAQSGLKAYRTLFHATCLIDSTEALAESNKRDAYPYDLTPSGTYCYVNAVTNKTSAADVYPYHLPLGLELPAGNRQSCSACTRRTMNVFAESARKHWQPIEMTYPAAAKTINLGCGPGFVDEVLAMSRAHRLSLPPSVSSSWVFAFVTILLICLLGR